VKAARGSEKTINISFDEWNVWYLSRYQNVDKITDPQEWPLAPRLLEDVYSVVDAVVFGNLLISLIRHADRVTAASLAQLVNVIAPIMTEPGGAAWRQTTFFPFALTSRLAKGVALELELDTPTYDTARHGTVGVVDAIATHDEESGQTAVFLVNRSLDEPVELVVDIALLGAVGLVAAEGLADPDIHAANTLADPQRVGLSSNDSARIDGGELRIVLPPVSWTAVTVR
jgi:alpha-L-arabinofuranosidase